VWCSDKDGVSTDAVHVDARRRLNVVQVNVAVLGYHIHNVVLWTRLDISSARVQTRRRPSHTYYIHVIDCIISVIWIIQSNPVYPANVAIIRYRQHHHYHFPNNRTEAKSLRLPLFHYLKNFPKRPFK